MEKAKPRQEMSGGVVAVAANVTPEPPQQISAARAANVTAEAPPRMTATTAAKVTPEPPPQISAAALAMPPSSSLSVEQMRMAGALAGARQKAKLATNKRF
jgi:hypothetical protein